MTQQAAAATPVGCPACGEPMRVLDLPRKPHGSLHVDLCPACRGLWFDAFESLQLTAAATLTLFREVASLGETRAPRRGGALACPRCRLRLAQTQDLQRTTRFSYWRCPRGHGRFTPFVQFMREKDFLRPLTPAETERLRAQLGSVRCSGCGAPVDLGREPACRYCGARVEALDPDAVRRAIDRLGGAPSRLPEVAPAAWTPAGRPPERPNRTNGFDLIVEGLRALLAAQER